MYQTLYRKYRPSNFNEVVGQKVIVKTLKNAITNNTLSHAYLFTGPRGTGKTSVAKILARTINCTNLIDNVPCNKCVNCTQNNSMDIIEIDAASNNGVDEIRELKSKVNLVPSLGKYKIYIIDEVHMLSMGAFNALLKTLEEPPSHAIFILATTDPHKVPSTILSRCQRFDFKKLNIDEIILRMKYIVDEEKINITDEALNEIALLSDGGMRDALSLLDQVIAYSEDNIKLEDIHEINGTITLKEQLELIKNIYNNNIEEIFKQIDKYNSNGKDFIKLTEELILFLRNVIIKINAPKYYEQNKIQDINDSFLDNLSSDKILQYIYLFNNSINEMKNSSNPRIIFELVIIKLLDNSNIEKIKPLNNLKKIRVNNTLCNFNKKQLIDFIAIKDEINKYINHSKYSEYIPAILDGKIKAMGKENIIIVLDNNQNVEKFNSEIEFIDELFNKTYNIDYKIIFVNNDEWEQIKQEFNSKKKEYKYINE